MAEIIKSGYIKRYSKSVLSGGWNQVFLTLHRDSTLNMYKKQGEYAPQLSILMKDVCKYFAYGEYTNGMPDRPDIPSGSSVKSIMGVPVKPSGKAKIIWFLFHSEAELHDWMASICSVLPPPPAKEHSGNAHHAHHAPTVSSAPPPVPVMPVGPPPPSMPVGHPPPQGGQPPALGFENLSLGGGAAPPPPQAYNPAPSYPGYPAPAQGPHAYPAPPYQPYPTSYPAPPPGAGYPQQPYAPPANSYYQPPPGQYAQGNYYQPPPGQYAQGGYGPYPQQGYQRPPHTTVVYQTQPVHVIQTKKKGGILGSNTGQIAAGLAGGALLGYGASAMMGGGWGCGRWGSWSSLSSFGSCGSFGSFSSFGSFD